VKDSHHAAPKIRDVSRETKKRSGAAPASPAKLVDGIASDARARVARWLGETTLHPRAGFFERIEKMAATLALWGAHTNLTADASDPAEIAFHVIDSLAPMAFAGGANREMLEAALAEGSTALDLGSGAGFPGLVLAAAFRARFTLAETRRKRASYLQVAAHEMDVENVAIEQRRVSARSVAGGFDLVTARAFGTSAELYEIAAASLSPGGILLLYASADQVLGASSGQVGSDQVLAEGAPESVIWTYRLPHGERVATRAAVLWRKPRAASSDL
jgi:16S rRNA (guanine527-N7)-methyltransferase